jgi:predicted unusual protein kinase regulating ubiquinone biosynthesis (AarF/ABC1/UbiB family)
MKQTSSPDVIQKELLNGAELSELFLEFDDKPLGSASIAQVSSAPLKTDCLFSRIILIQINALNIALNNLYRTVQNKLHKTALRSSLIAPPNDLC